MERSQLMRPIVAALLLLSACGSDCGQPHDASTVSQLTPGHRLKAACIPVDGHGCEFVLPGAPDAQPAALHQVLRFMAAGDTNSVGLSSSSTLGSYRTALWTTATANGYKIDYVGDQYNGPGYSTVSGGTFVLDGGLLDHEHEGLVGDTIEAWTTYYNNHQLAREYHPDVVALNLGTYNVNAGGFNATTEGTAYAALVDQILADCTGLSSLFGDCLVIMVTVPPQSSGTFTTNAVAMNAQIATIATTRRRTVIADLYTLVAPYSGTNFFDTLTFNATGMTAWAGLMWSTILRLY